MEKLNGLFKHKTDRNVRIMCRAFEMIRYNRENKIISHAIEMLLSVHKFPKCYLANYLLEKVPTCRVSTLEWFRSGSYSWELASEIVGYWSENKEGGQISDGAKDLVVLFYKLGGFDLLDGNLKQRCVKILSNLGDPLFCSIHANELRKDGQKQRALDLVIAAAYLDEREAYYRLGSILQDGDEDLGIVKNSDAAMFFFKKAIKMGCRKSIHRLITYFEPENMLHTYYNYATLLFDPCWIFTRNYHANGYVNDDGPYFQNRLIDDFPRITSNPRLLYMIGKLIVTTNVMDILSFTNICDGRLVKKHVRAIRNCYLDNISKTKAAIYTLSLCCRRICRVTFDHNIRQKLGKLVWQQRKNFEYLKYDMNTYLN